MSSSESSATVESLFRKKCQCFVKNAIVGSDWRVPLRTDAEGLDRWLIHRKYLDKPLLVFSILYVFMAIFESPRYGEDPPYFLSFHVLIAFEGVVVLVFLSEAFFEASFRMDSIWETKGWIDWIRKDWWAAARLGAIVFVVFDFIIWVGTPLQVRVSPFLRPLFIICRKSWMRSVSKAALYAVASSISVLILLVVHLFWFSVIGFAVFSAEAYQFNITKPDNRDDICDVFERNGCNDYFHQIPEALYTSFITITTVNFPDVMLPYFNAGGWYAIFAAVYFFAFYVIGLYFLMNLLLATIYNEFREQTKHSTIQKTKFRKQWIERFWSVAVEHFAKEGHAAEKTNVLSKEQWLKVFSFVRPKVPPDVAVLIFRAIVTKSTKSFEKSPSHRLIAFSALKGSRSRENDRAANETVALCDLIGGWQFLVIKISSKMQAREDGEAPKEAREDDDDAKSVGSSISDCYFKNTAIEEYRARLKTLVTRREFELTTDVLVVCNAILLGTLLAQDAGTNSDTTKALQIIAILLLAYFVVEIFARIVASGGFRLFWIEHEDKPFVRFDSIAIGISFISVILRLTVTPNIPGCGTVESPCERTQINEGTILAGRLLGTLQLLRTFRLIRFFKSEFLAAIRIMRSLSVYVLWFACAIYPWIILGNVLFVGSLSFENEAVRESTYGEHYYYALHFDTFASSFVVLWHQLVVNNWPIVAAGCVASNGRIARLFFVLFHVYAVLMVLNILISMIIEVYGMVYERTDNTLATKNWRRRLRDAASSMGRDGTALMRRLKFRMPATTGVLVRNVFYDEVPEDLKPLLLLDRT